MSSRRCKARLALAAAAVLFAAVVPVFAQQSQTLRIAGTVERVDGQRVTVKPRDGGATLAVDLTGDVAVFGVSKAPLSDIKPGAFIGVGAMPQPDGSQRAIQVTIFAESQRGTGEGHRPWDRAPDSTMTNATVEQTVAGVDGQVVMVKYKDGEKRIVVPSDATILAYSNGDVSELKPGAQVAILRAKKMPDGGLQADRVNVGRGDVMPQ